MSSAIPFCTIHRKHTQSDVIGLFLGKRTRRKTFPPVPISLVVGFCIPNLGNVVILPARFLLLHRAFPRHEVSEGRGCAQDGHGKYQRECFHMMETARYYWTVRERQPPDTKKQRDSNTQTERDNEIETHTFTKKETHTNSNKRTLFIWCCILHHHVQFIHSSGFGDA